MRVNAILIIFKEIIYCYEGHRRPGRAFLVVERVDVASPEGGGGAPDCDGGGGGAAAALVPSSRPDRRGLDERPRPTADELEACAPAADGGPDGGC